MTRCGSARTGPPRPRGDAVHLRGLVEVTNYCVRACAYCGIAACAGPLPRYRMTREEILACARQGRDFGFGTVVLQGGEDPGLSGPFVADVACAITAWTRVRRHASARR